MKLQGMPLQQPSPFHDIERFGSADLVMMRGPHRVLALEAFEATQRASEVATEGLVESGAKGSILNTPRLSLLSFDPQQHVPEFPRHLSFIGHAAPPFVDRPNVREIAPQTKRLKESGLHCPKAESGECAECPVGREFNIEDINP
jgi:hypothetical protein